MTPRQKAKLGLWLMIGGFVAEILQIFIEGSKPLDERTKIQAIFLVSSTIISAFGIGLLTFQIFKAINKEMREEMAKLKKNLTKSTD